MPVTINVILQAARGSRPPQRAGSFLSSRTLFLAALVLAPVGPPAAAKDLGWNADTLHLELDSIKRLPPLPEGVTELKFADFYTMPLGPRGLECTEWLKQLDGKRVRILGFMVRQTRPAMGIALLASYAITTHEGEYGLCDDLPAATLFVVVPKFRGIAVPFTPGPLLLTGRLELGRREESDGRVSYVRLVLEPEAAAGTTALPR
jgi:hypothetical protein